MNHPDGHTRSASAAETRRRDVEYVAMTGERHTHARTHTHTHRISAALVVVDLLDRARAGQARRLMAHVRVGGSLRPIDARASERRGQCGRGRIAFFNFLMPGASAVTASSAGARTGCRV